jgi:hypothetical protein
MLSVLGGKAAHVPSEHCACPKEGLQNLSLAVQLSQRRFKASSLLQFGYLQYFSSESGRLIPSRQRL